jgi:hypothetical protein
MANQGRGKTVEASGDEAAASLSIHHRGIAYRFEIERDIVVKVGLDRFWIKHDEATGRWYFRGYAEADPALADWACAWEAPAPLAEDGRGNLPVGDPLQRQAGHKD